MDPSNRWDAIPSFSARERLVIVLGILVIVFWVVSIYTGPLLVIFGCLVTLGILALMVFQQIKELRAVAHTLHESEERFRLLVNEVQDYAIFGVTPDGKIATWNHGAERILGFTSDEVVGKPFSVLRAITEGRTDFSAQVFEDARRAGRYYEEAWYEIKGGKRFLAGTAITPLATPDEALRGFSVVMCDITARKQAEQLLVESHKFIERITRAIPDIVFICEFETRRKIYINDETSAILGYSKPELAAMGEKFFDHVLHPDDWTKFSATRWQLGASRDGKAGKFECRMKHARGEWRLLNCRSVVFARSVDGVPQQCLGIAQDVTELKRAQEEAKRMEHAAVAKQRLALIGEFSASVAHEFRNPMQGVLNCVEELRSRASGDKSYESTVSLLEDGVLRMDRISSRLLRLARSHGDVMVPTDIAQCIEGTCALVRARAQKHKIRLETEIESNLPLVSILPERISEALLNLVGNALDACEEGGRVTVSAGRASTQNMLELCVQDTGCGIPREIQDRIFELFFSTKPPGEGTGLGMAIVRRSIEAHGGTIELVESSKKGTTFRALIPM